MGLLNPNDPTSTTVQVLVLGGATTRTALNGTNVAVALSALDVDEVMEIESDVICYLTAGKDPVDPTATNSIKLFADVSTRFALRKGQKIKALGASSGYIKVTRNG